MARKRLSDVTCPGYPGAEQPQSGSRLVTVLRRMRWPVVITWLSPAGFPRTGPGRWPGPQPWPSAAVAVAAPAPARPGAGVSGSGGPASHETRVEGILDGRWAAWFGGLQAQGAGAHCHLRPAHRAAR